MLIVRFGDMRSRELASCCRVLVVCGGSGRRVVSLTSMERTTNAGVRSVTAPLASRPSAAMTSAASASVPSSSFSRSAASVSPRLPTRRALNGLLPSLARRASMVHDSTGTNASISVSRSTTRRTATDCTRPAESPARTLRHSSGESRYPTRRSITRRASWADTSERSIFRGCASAASTASLVISWKTMRSGLLRPSASARCQAIASPSRSGSAASRVDDAFLTAARRSRICFSLPLMSSYCGVNPASTSTPIFDFGRSRTCPMEASTMYSDPRKRASVRALLGDSTMIRRDTFWTS